MKKLNVLVVILMMSILMTGCSLNEEIKEDEAAEEAQREDNAESVEYSQFEVHYIDVGQADATLIMCDGENMLIDGGNSDDSSLIYSYLEEHNVSKLDYIICTHPHEDHVGGLSGALNYAQVDTVYCPVYEHDLEAFDHFVRYVGEQGKEIEIPEEGTVFKLGSAECTILEVNAVDINESDIYDLENLNTDIYNNISIVLKIQYGETVFLFSGDADQSVEAGIIDKGYDINCTVMKIPHHGSDTSLSDEWLSEAKPEYGIISAGEDNSYGHPCEETLNKLKYAGVKVFRTDLQGHIVCTSDGKEVHFEVERNETADTFQAAGIISVSRNPEETDTETDADMVATEGYYIININTEKFHYPDCRSVDDMKESNKKETNLTRDELVLEGYSPCGNCKP